jgi:hypothetical protein
MEDYFSDCGLLLTEADQLLKEDASDAYDRSLIQAFYNGQRIKSEEEAKNEDSESLINHLFGWSSMARAASRIEAPINQPIIWRLEFPSIPINIRKNIEHKATKKFNEILHESGRLRQPIRSIAGEATLHGRGCLAHTDQTTWWPKFIDPLVPRGTRACRDDVPYIIVPSSMNRRELENALRMSSSEGSSWNKKAVEQAIKAIKSNVGGSGSGHSINRTTPAEEQSAKAQATDVSTINRLNLPVYFCYVSNPSKPSNPWDIVIIPRYNSSHKTAILGKSKDESEIDLKLYHGRGIFECVEQMLHPMFLEANIGGDLQWHNTIGMGRIAFESDQDYEDGFNTMMASIKETMRRLYAVSATADRDELNRFLTETHNLIPEGVTMVEVPKLPNYQHIMGALGMLSNHSRKLAASSSGGQDDFDDELQIQAQERQQEQQEMLSRRMSNIYAFFKPLGCEIVRRFFVAPVNDDSDGYKEVMEFRDYMVELVGADGFDELKWEKNGYLVNVRVKTVKAQGDGDRQQAMQGNRNVMAQAHRLSPERQQDALRNFIATETNDAEMADYLVPQSELPDEAQAWAARSENTAAHEYGLTGQPIPINATDLPVRHIPIHFMGIEALLKIGEKEGWEEQDLAAFMALGAHAAAHVMQIKAVPEMREQANKLMQALQQFARRGKEFQNNMMAFQKSKELTPLEQATIQEKGIKSRAMVEKIAMSKQKAAKTQDMHERKFALQQEDSAFNREAKARELALKTTGQTYDQMMEAINAQIDVQQDRPLLEVKKNRAKPASNK